MFTSSFERTKKGKCGVYFYWSKTAEKLAFRPTYDYKHITVLSLIEIMPFRTLPFIRYNFCKWFSTKRMACCLKDKIHACGSLLSVAMHLHMYIRTNNRLRQSYRVIHIHSYSNILIHIQTDSYTFDLCIYVGNSNSGHELHNSMMKYGKFAKCTHTKHEDYTPYRVL